MLTPSLCRIFTALLYITLSVRRGDTEDYLAQKLECLDSHRILLLVAVKLSYFCSIWSHVYPPSHDSVERHHEAVVFRYRTEDTCIYELPRTGTGSLVCVELREAVTAVSALKILRSRGGRDRQREINVMRASINGRRRNQRG